MYNVDNPLLVPGLLTFFMTVVNNVDSPRCPRGLLTLFRCGSDPGRPAAPGPSPSRPAVGERREAAPHRRQTEKDLPHLVLSVAYGRYGPLSGKDRPRIGDGGTCGR
jgi:hypothetical protein